MKIFIVKVLLALQLASACKTVEDNSHLMDASKSPWIFVDDEIEPLEFGFAGFVRDVQWCIGWDEDIDRNRKYVLEFAGWKTTGKQSFESYAALVKGQRKELTGKQSLELFEEFIYKSWSGGCDSTERDFRLHMAARVLTSYSKLPDVKFYQLKTADKLALAVYHRAKGSRGGFEIKLLWFNTPRPVKSAEKWTVTGVFTPALSGNFIAGYLKETPGQDVYEPYSLQAETAAVVDAMERCLEKPNHVVTVEVFLKKREEIWLPQYSFRNVTCKKVEEEIYNRYSALADRAFFDFLDSKNK